MESSERNFTSFHKYYRKEEMAMKVVNPVGRSVLKLETGANLVPDVAQPMQCICSSGSRSLGRKYSCGICACQCDDGVVNRNANNVVAQNGRNHKTT